jgi:hypothetical protein
MLKDKGTTGFQLEILINEFQDLVMAHKCWVRIRRFYTYSRTYSSMIYILVPFSNDYQLENTSELNTGKVHQ